MKKILLLSLILIPLANGIHAQVTLTGNDVNYSAGSTFALHQGSLTTFNAGSSGNGVVWDFSGLSCPNSLSMSLLSPTGLPGASNFPWANLAMSDGSGGYIYEYTDNTKWERYGLYSTSSSVAMVYSNSEVFFSFPLSFNDTQSDNFLSNYNLSGYPTTRSGTVNSTYDGYGTLMLPYGTLNNIARLHATEVFSDDISGYGTIDYSVDVYIFIKPGTGYPVFTMTNYQSTSGSAMYCTYLDQSHVGFNEPNLMPSLSVYPNPADDFVSVEFENNSIGTAIISVFDLNGKLVLEFPFEVTQTGYQNTTIDVSSLTSGLYLLNVKTAEQSGFMKLNVE